MPQRILNVAEKNDAAKELAKILSHGRSQRVSFKAHLKNVTKCCSLIFSEKDAQSSTKYMSST